MLAKLWWINAKTFSDTIADQSWAPYWTIRERGRSYHTRNTGSDGYFVNLNATGTTAVTPLAYHIRRTKSWKHRKLIYAVDWLRLNYPSPPTPNPHPTTNEKSASRDVI